MKSKKFKLNLTDLQENQTEIRNFLQKKEMEDLFGGNGDMYLEAIPYMNTIPYPRCPYCRIPYLQAYRQVVPYIEMYGQAVRPPHEARE